MTVLDARKVLVAGDTHGEAGWFGWLTKRAVSNGCDVILQLGDFGYWEHYDDGAYLDHVERHLADAGLTCVWIDGNHENHPMLWTKYGNDGFVRVRERLFYAPRGHRWTWQGVRFLALGGAYSIDARYRTEGLSWWPEEVITPEQEAVAIDGGRTDVLVAHDCPWGVTIPSDDPNTGFKNGHPISQENRERVERVAKATCPTLILHGHYHVGYAEQWGAPLLDPNDAIVHGFGRDGDRLGAWGVLELPSLVMRRPNGHSTGESSGAADLLSDALIGPKEEV